jgi:hypothetical protein
MNKLIPPNKNMLGEVFKSSLFFKKDICYLKNTVSPSLVPELRKMLNYDVEIRYFDPDVQCPTDNIRLSWNGTHKTSINNLSDVRKQKYICPKCGYTHYTKLTCMNPNAQFTNEYQYLGLGISFIHDISLENWRDTGIN